MRKAIYPLPLPLQRPTNDRDRLYYSAFGICMASSWLMATGEPLTPDGRVNDLLDCAVERLILSDQVPEEPRTHIVKKGHA